MDFGLQIFQSKESKKTSDLYSAQFDYQDLIKRLSDLQEKQNSKVRYSIFKTFDNKKVAQKKVSKQSLGKKRLNNSMSIYQDRKKDQSSYLIKRNNIGKAGSKHKRNATDLTFDNDFKTFCVQGKRHISNISVRKPYFN
ncbi:hypothetical protein SteCoe_7284 [Stentor coeruleus]|uniref:Uncharacterized protein n=1 Tax=Stentor coeruleus TaxID=5963 RepID=A0A1R2CMY3_9CILI|nr:hypothetical protein SteCoe_7284 [Stentor coeruleus]